MGRQRLRPYGRGYGRCNRNVVIHSGYRIPTEEQLVDALELADQVWWRSKTKAPVASGICIDVLDPLIIIRSVCDSAKAEVCLGINNKEEIVKIKCVGPFDEKIVFRRCR